MIGEQLDRRRSSQEIRHQYQIYGEPGIGAQIKGTINDLETQTSIIRTIHIILGDMKKKRTVEKPRHVTEYQRLNVVLQ